LLTVFSRFWEGPHWSHIHNQFPEGLLPSFGIKVPEGVVDGGGGQSDHALLRPYPAR